jgi:hypothetical protein
MLNTACNQLSDLKLVQYFYLLLWDHNHRASCIPPSGSLRICIDKIRNTNNPGLPLLKTTFNFLQAEETKNKQSTLKELDNLIQQISQRDPNQYDFKANHCLDRCLTDLRSQQEIKKVAFNTFSLCLIHLDITVDISYSIGQFGNIVPACPSNAAPPTDNNHSTTTTPAPYNNI